MFDLSFANNSKIVVGFDDGPNFTDGPQNSSYSDLLAKSYFEPSGNNGAVNTGTITIGGLKIGHVYDVELWSPYWNNNFNGTFGGNLMNVGFDSVTPQYIVGTFTADATSQVIGIGPGQAGFAFLPGALEIRDVPEPSSIVVLCGLGALGLLLFARRRRKVSQIDNRTISDVSTRSALGENPLVATIRGTAVLLIACGLSVVLGVAPAQAAPVAAISYNGGLTQGRSDNDYTIGNEILVGSQNLIVSELGVQDINGSGITGAGIFAPPISVGIWNATGTTLLATAQVTNSDPAEAGGYRYASITPITLTAGTNYLIGAYVGNDIEWFGDGDSQTPNITPYSGNLVTLVSANYNFNGDAGLQAPTSSGGDAGATERWVRCQLPGDRSPRALLGCCPLWPRCDGPAPNCSAAPQS